MKKKIVWLCAFSSKELAELLGEKKELIVSPWMNEFVNLFRKNNDFEFYLITPNYINNSNVKLTIDNINVCLYKFHPNYISEKFYNLTIQYPLTKKNVSKLIREINPDLIHLFGAENPVYGSAIVNNHFHCPILVSPQAFIRNSPKTNSIVKNFIRWNRIRYESKILDKQKFFTVATSDVINELNKNNSNSIKFKLPYPTSYAERVHTTSSNSKDFDISFFGQISRDKGIEDFLEIIYRVKDKFPNIKVVIIGGGNDFYISQIKKQIIKLNLSSNIHFAGYQKIQSDAFALLARSKIYVLPTYYDGLPGTIREAMYLKVAVIAYAVGGIPKLNDNLECIKCVPVHNINSMVKEVIELLENENRRALLIKNAYDVITQDYSNELIKKELIGIYKNILA